MSTPLGLEQIRHGEGGPIAAGVAAGKALRPPTLAPGALTVPETADYLGISPAHVYRLIRGGQIPAKKLGRSLRVPRVQLDRWLASTDRELVATDNQTR